MKKMLLTLGMILSISSVSAKINVEKIQNLIHDHGANWTAKKSWVTELSQEELAKMLGNNEVVHNNLDYSDAYDKSATYETVDWRNVNGINWLGQVLNQGNCGSCVAFATVATLEAQTSIASGAAWLKPQFSTQALFACGGGSCSRGWYPSSAASFVLSKGVIDSACSPYLSGSTGDDVACKQFCGDQSARTFKPTGVYKPTTGFGGSVSAVKEALKKGPLVTTMIVYEDFVAYAGGIYKAVSNKSVGGHAVSIVGFSDEGRYWIVRNSWGEDWGEKGFVRISWDDKSGIGGSTIGFNIGAQENTVAVISPAENDFVSDEVKLKISSVKEGDFTLKLKNQKGVFQDIDCEKSASEVCEGSLNSNELADGKYEIIAESSNSKSFVRGFTVINHEPQMAISFKPAAGVDLSQPLVGRLEFDIVSSAKPVQMQKIDFIVQKLDGSVAARRTTDMVLEKMKLGFRFNSIPNGKYEIFYRGYIPVKGKMFTVDSEHVKVTTKN